MIIFVSSISFQNKHLTKENLHKFAVIISVAGLAELGVERMKLIMHEEKLFAADTCTSDKYAST
jgi:hypothetical protein